MDVMFRENWLLSYRTVEGIDKILTQMDRRTKTSPKCNLQQKNFKNFMLNLKRVYPLFSRFTRTCSEAINKHTQNDLN
jgi:acyl carrier protein phosphodiesterase